MAIPFLHNVDLNRNELQNAKFQILAADPVSPAEGLFWYNSADKVLKYYNGTDIIVVSESFDLHALTAEAALADADEIPFYDVSATANRKSTWANIVSKIRTAFFGTANGILKANGSGVVSAATKGTDYLAPVTGAVNGNLAGLNASGVVVDSGSQVSDFVAATVVGSANGVASLGANGKVPSTQLPGYVDDVIDLLTCSDAAPTGAIADDKYYAPTAKKIYTYSGSAWDAGVDGESGKIYVAIDTGYTYRWGGTAVGLVQIGGTGEVNTTKYGETNAALTPSGGVCSWVVTHNLNSRAVIVGVYLAASPYTEVLCEIEHTAVNSVTVKIVSASTIAAGTYAITVIG